MKPLLLAAALLLAGCCSLRHAGNPCVTCINGKVHQVCDAPECGARPVPVASKEEVR